jgi:hypothetical protein
MISHIRYVKASRGGAKGSRRRLLPFRRRSSCVPPVRRSRSVLKRAFNGGVFLATMATRDRLAGPYFIICQRRRFTSEPRDQDKFKLHRTLYSTFGSRIQCGAPSRESSSDCCRYFFPPGISEGVQKRYIRRPKSPSTSLLSPFPLHPFYPRGLSLLWPSQRVRDLTTVALIVNASQRC